MCSCAFHLDDGSEIIVRLDDNPAADALYETLPLELTFEDFNGTEKIAYLPDELPADGAPGSCDPDEPVLLYPVGQSLLLLSGPPPVLIADLLGNCGIRDRIPRAVRPGVGRNDDVTHD